MIRRAVAGAVCVVSCAALPASAQRTAPPELRGMALVADLVDGLGTSARVLVIGAHPDDEDTNLITWLSRGRHIETAYLSITRGESGQNVIGNEQGAALGMIRTSELLAARRLDGAHQYFTRAIDFGFAKTAQDVFARWPRDVILRDVITVVRAFRPHVIVTMSEGAPRDAHGQHEAAGLLARAAFELAGDATRYPVATTARLQPWTPLKLYRAAATVPAEASLTINTGEYSPVLGRSYAELAAIGRSQHLSQGMGTPQLRGAMPSYLRLEVARGATPPAPGSPERSMMDGVDTSWARFSGIAAPLRATLDSLRLTVDSLRAGANYARLDGLVPPLARIVTLARAAREATGCREEFVPQCAGATADLAATLNVVVERASRALVEAAGVVVDATADQELAAIGDTIAVTISLYNQGRIPVTVAGGYAMAEGERIDITAPPVTVLADSAIHYGGAVVYRNVSFPWWLLSATATDTAFYRLPMTPGNPVISELVMGEDRIRGTEVALDLEIAGTKVRARVDAITRRATDPTRGEVRTPMVGVPRTSVLLEREVEYAPANTTIDRTVRVYVTASGNVDQKVVVALSLPDGLRPDSATRTITVKRNSTSSAYFRIRGTLAPGRYAIAASASVGKEVYTSGFAPVRYAHIDPMYYYRASRYGISAVDAHVPKTLAVAYVKGIGDLGDEALDQLGIDVETIAPGQIALLDFTRATTLVIGPRAYLDPEMESNAAAVLNFARRGGTVVVQGGQQEMMNPGIMPYPITLQRPSDRVADERAAVTVVDTASRLLRTPNLIGPLDWTRWVQDRALFVPRAFDPRYRSVISMHDKDESPLEGTVLSTTLGRGTYIYTTLSFFRQLGAGNTGAARLFVNMLAAGVPPVPPR